MTNKEKRLAQNRKWYYSKAGQDYFTKRSNDIDYICRMACARLKVRAKKKNLPFDLTPDYLISIFPKDRICKVLGYKMRVNRFSKIAKQDKFTPTINRINSDKGYIKGNVEFICQLANLMLANANENELKLFNNYLNNKLYMRSECH